MTLASKPSYAKEERMYIGLGTVLAIVLIIVLIILIF
jgi:hypothetical protein